METDRFIKKDFLLKFLPPNTEQTSYDVFACHYNIDFYKPNLYSKFRTKTPEAFNQMVPKRQAEYLAGRYCSRKALKALNIKSFDIMSDSKRCPIWPRGVHGSISHTSEIAMAVVTDEQQVAGIGIDIEPIVEEDKTLALANQILLQPTEEELYRQSPEPALVFTLIFSLKESFFKAAFPQVKKIFGFDAIEVLAIDKASQSFTLQIRKPLSAQLRIGKVIKGYYQKPDHNLITLCVI